VRHFIQTSGVRASVLAFTAVCTLLAAGDLSARSRFSGRAKPIEPAKATIVVDAETGRILFSERSDAPVYPASLTKMMTLYLIFEALDSRQLTFDTRISVSQHSANQPPTKLGLIPGQTVAVSDIILGLVTKSANDAAVAVAERIGGSEEEFAAIMTRRARSLGMTNTYFRNASGLPDTEQVTTARDLATLSRALIVRFPHHYHFFARQDFTYGEQLYASHNRLLGSYDGLDGIKTGYIRASGYNLAASAVRGGRRYIVVAIGGRTAQQRDQRVAALLDDAFDGNLELKPTVVARLPEVPHPPRPIEIASAPVRMAPAPTPVVLKSPNKAAPLPRVRRLTAESDAIAQPQPPAQSADADNWAIQLGAFKVEAQAQAAISAAQKLAPSLVNGHDDSVTLVRNSSGRVYRARITGFDRKEAGEACRVLMNRRQSCAVVRHPTTTGVAALQQ
jgi:D-alanyl-D-alanine carboxypeptidase